MPPADDRPTASLNGHAPDPTGTPPPGSTAEGVPLPSTAAHADTAGFEAWVTGVVAGRYRRLELHDSGGLGEVLRAEDTVLGRDVALKRLRRDRHTPALRDRFLREARVTGRLEHPNIVPVYDLVESDDPVYAMRFLPGSTLADAVKAYHQRRTAGTATPLELPKLLEAFVKVCEAVAYAHSRGVLHRDLKGANILRGEFGEVCLADWGLAKRTADPDQPGDPHPLDPPLDGATADGAVIGTPAFMAPELARAERATVASDVYALGAVLYQVLTDHPPHTGSHKEVLSKLETGAAVSPARELVPSVHPALDAVCRKALSRDPAARYPSATAVADEVRAYLAGEPVAAYPEPWTARAARWVRRHRAGVLAGVVGLAVLAVASTAAAVLVYREKERAEANFEMAWALSTSLTDAVVRTETGAPPGPAELAGWRRSVGQATVASERFLAAQPDSPVHLSRTALLLRCGGNLARMTDDLAEADRAFMASAGLRERAAQGRAVDPVTAVTLALTLSDAAGVAELDGRLEAAAARTDQAIGWLNQFGPADYVPPEARRARGLALTRRSGIELKVGQAAAAVKTADQAAGLFDGLTTGPPDDWHPLDLVFLGLARTSAAKARRELARAHPRPDWAAPLADHAAAAEVFRQAVEANPGVDAVFNAHLAQAERAKTLLLAGDVASAVAEADAAAIGLRRVWADNRAVPVYQHRLASGLIVRGQARSELARIGPTADPALRGLAAADFQAAAALLNPLIRARPTRPAYRSDYGAAWAGLARLASAQDGRDVWYFQAVSASGSAADSDPGNRLYRATRDALRAEAVAAGCDPARWPTDRAAR